MKHQSALLLAALLFLAGGAVFADNENDDSGVTVEDESDTENMLEYVSPVAEPGRFYFAEHFDDKNKFEQRWVRSQAKKEGTDEEIAKYDGIWSLEEPVKTVFKNDLGMVLKTKAKHAAIAARLNKPFVFNDKPLVVQYEVMWQDGQECGGSYIKLLSSGKETTDLSKLHDKTPYTIMFGPDKCGNDAKLHFIFRHVNPINGSITEKHSRKPKDRLEEPFKDKQPHLYQLIVRPDNTFVVRVDHKTVNEGSLLIDFHPPVNPPKQIDDPTDKKPASWDEREKIPDPDAVKPDDWDEDAPPQIPDPTAVKPDGWLDDVEEMIPDPDALKPDDWENDIDGEWEPPLIPNPVCEKAVGCGVWKAPLVPNSEYKGKWRAPMIDNPNYQGKWAPRKIPNPDFFEDFNPFKMTAISAVGFELWSMSSEILFDNLVISDDEEAVREWAAQTFDIKRKQLERQADSLVTRVARFTEENPWMWAIYVVVIGLPATILLYLCCGKKDKAETAHPKKTDEPTADDELQADEDVAPELLKGKADLGDPNAPSSENQQDSEDEVDDEEAEKNSDPDNEEVEEIAEEAEAAAVPTTGTRKRKTRKD